MSLKPSDLLDYLPDHKVIVCKSCQYALQPTGILRHLKDVHHILRSRRKPFADHISHYDLATIEKVIQSSDRLKRFPVAGLPVFDGLRCTHRGCGHMCVAEKRMKAHWSLVHGRIARSDVDWTSVPLQTFFKGNALRYFTRSPQPLLTRPAPRAKGCLAEDPNALMQHYIKSVSPTLADEASANDGSIIEAPISLWQQTIPELAQRSEFLNLIILACSTLHLAYLDLSHRQEYLLAAASYQEQAIPLYRSAISDRHPHNCHSILAFIHLLTICSFASEPENERLLLVDPSGPDIVSGWLMLMRGGCSYVETVKEIVTDGPMQSLLCNYVLPDTSRPLHTPLVDGLLSIIPDHDAEDAWTEHECQIYRRAVNELGYGLTYVNSLGRRLNTWDLLRAWPMVVSMGFLSMLRDEHPGALVALAQYCVLLRRLDGKWYAEGRAKRLLGHILQRLDTKWQAGIDWSLAE